MMDIDKELLVSICCITYNHEPYLQKTLEGFLMQKTKFPYEIIIHDDCSTDGTRTILENFKKKYKGSLKILYAKNNQFSQGVNIGIDIMLPHVKGKYAAICEGDDWWTDPFKLQKQVDFMESHSDCVLTVHNGIKFDCETKEETVINPFYISGFLTEEQNYMAFMNNPPTASFVVRKSVLDSYPEYIREAPVLDDVLRLYCFDKGTIYYFHDIMCCRSIKHKDSWNTLLLEQQSLYENYVVRILEFYRQHDCYTNYKHSALIQIVCRKIANRFKYLADENVEKQVLNRIGYLSGVDMEG